MDKILEYASGKYKASNRKIAQGYQTYTWDESYNQFKQATGAHTVAATGRRVSLVDYDKVVEANIR